MPHQQDRLFVAAGLRHQRVERIAEHIVRFAPRLDAMRGKMLLEARAHRIDARLVVGAGIDIHGVAQQVDHRLLLRREPFGDLRFGSGGHGIFLRSFRVGASTLQHSRHARLPFVERRILSPLGKRRGCLLRITGFPELNQPDFTFRQATLQHSRHARLRFCGEAPPDFLSQINLIGPTGKSIPICGNRVKPKIRPNRKYFCFTEPQINATSMPSRPDQRGVS